MDAIVEGSFHPQQMEGSCDFPYVGVNCTKTFADITTYQYLAWSHIFFFAGFVAFFLSITQFVRSFRFGGSHVQQAIFLLLIIASISFVIRGIDPFGYAAVLPKIIDDISSSICASCLVSICFTVVVFWIALVENKAQDFVYPKWVKIFGFMAHAIVWLTLIILTIVGNQSDSPWYNAYYSIRLGVVALLMWISSFSALLYGSRLRSQVREIQRLQEVDQALERLDEDNSLRSDASVEEAIQSQKFCSSCFGNTRIVRILVVIQLFSLVTMVVILYRLYTLYTKTSLGDYKEWRNCNNCDNAAFSFPCISSLQIVGIYISFWAFHKIKKESPKSSFHLDVLPVTYS